MEQMLSLKYCELTIDSATGEYSYSHFGGSELVVEFHGVKKEDIRKVRIIPNEEETETPYWAYWCNERKEFSHVYPSILQVKMCSPDFFESAIRKGKGKILNVFVHEIENQ